MQAKQTKGSTWTFTNLVNLVNIPLHGQKDTKEKLLARPPVMAQDWHSDIPAACPSLRLPRGPRHPTAAPSPLICPSTQLPPEPPCPQLCPPAHHPIFRFFPTVGNF